MYHNVPEMIATYPPVINRGNGKLPIYKWFSNDIHNIHWLNPYVHGQLFNKECTALSTKDVCAGGGEAAAELAADIMKAFWIRAASAKVATSSRSFL